MPVLPAHKPFLAVFTDSGIYVDHFNPFGLSSAAGTLGVATDATVDIVKAALGVTFFIKWVDDLLPTHTPLGKPSPLPYQYKYTLDDILHIITSLDWLVNDIKTKQFSTSMVYVGFAWDIAQKHVSVPEKKRLKHLAKLSQVMLAFDSSSHSQLAPLINLQGSLSHLCFVYHEGCSQMPALHQFIASFHGNPFIHWFPPPCLLSDLQWWHAALENPSYYWSIIFWPLIDLCMSVDASSSWGISLLVGSLWRAWHLLPGWDGQGHHIGWAESVALEFAIMEIATHGLHDVHVLIHSDNQGSIGQFLHGCSQNIFINESITCTSSITQQANFDIVPEYVESSRNLADAASCGVLPPDSLCLPHI
jgi:hypothetical protein